VSSPRAAWRSLWRDAPGQRFTRRYERLRARGHPLWRRALGIVLGVLLILVGAVFMVLPGPGLVPVVAGLALLASDSPRIARGLDRAELKIRRWRGRRRQA
jgi:hypothetical protein